MEKREIHIGFMVVDPSNTNAIQRRALQCWAGSDASRIFSHVELRFSDAAVTSVSQAVGHVYLVENKLMQNPNYNAFVSLDVTAEQEASMREMAESYNRRGVAFNTRGMMCNFLPLFSACFYSEGKQDAVFCSQYVTLLLQSAGYLSELQPARTTPNQLYEALKASGARPAFNRELYDAIKHTLPPLKIQFSEKRRVARFP